MTPSQKVGDTIYERSLVESLRVLLKEASAFKTSKNTTIIENQE